MSTLRVVIPIPSPITVAIAATVERYPVHRIYCVGRNYAEHVQEMGGDVERTPPVFFTKPADAVLADGADFPYPPRSQDVQPEVELVIAIGQGGANIAVDAALSHIYGYAIGNDWTRRDLQTTAKRGGAPWDLAKGFDHSAAVGAIYPVGSIGHPCRGLIRLEVNGVERQRGDLSAMIWSVPAIIAELSTYVTLVPGDLIFTGTPAGVTSVVPGDQIECHIEGLGTLSSRVVERQ